MSNETGRGRLRSATLDRAPGPPQRVRDAWERFVPEVQAVLEDAFRLGFYFGHEEARRPGSSECLVLVDGIRPEQQHIYKYGDKCARCGTTMMSALECRNRDGRGGEEGAGGRGRERDDDDSTRVLRLARRAARLREDCFRLGREAERADVQGVWGVVQFVAAARDASLDRAYADQLRAALMGRWCTPETWLKEGHE